MKTFRYEIIKKSKVESRIQARYHYEIKTLHGLGFSDMQYVREVVFPFSAVFFFWFLPVLRSQDEVFTIEFPLRVVRMYPVMIHRGSATYGVMTGEGVGFSTYFTDGTSLLYHNYKHTFLVKDEAHRFYRFIPPGDEPEPVHHAFRRHLQNIDSFTRKGREPDDQLTMLKFEHMVQLNDKMAVIG